MDLTILAYATLGLSLFVSAVKMGGWILHADPRTILNGGRWALVAFAALALGVLIWLVMTGRWSSAMMLAAFMLPILCRPHRAGGFCLAPSMPCEATFLPSHRISVPRAAAFRTRAT